MSHVEQTRHAGGDALQLRAERRRIARHRGAIAAIDALPANVLHEDIDIGRGLGAEVHVIRVLVHVEGEDGCCASEQMRVIGRPLIDEPPLAR